ncbi:PAS domain S-box-containing protein [Cyclobacterium lianum]|uniref:histidine kinase n=1 Tax=Cyclobacterium lianum TaxID=388280 RepID=A0A1M7QR43_9BACT|nr:response regulator [Cyclobacterium lianum]SHN34063.1 PAS domain S-box-containing protein [Cyclobacterium lianum]
MNSNAAPYPENETQRLEALYATQLLDTLPETSFDKITELAAAICDTPIALVTFVDQDRQWFKSKVGLDLYETRRSDSFCQFTILQDELFEVPDAEQDSRFAQNKYVSGEEHIRFYAGYPIKTENGLNLGTLCVLDNKPRKLREDQIQALHTLSREVETLIQLQLEKLRLQNLNQKLEKVLTHLGDLVLLADKNFVIVEYFVSGKNQLSWPSEINTKKEIDVSGIPGEHGTVIKNLLDEVFTTGNKQFREYSVTNEREEDWYEISCEPSTAENNEALCIINQVSHIKKRELRIKDRENEARKFFEQAQGLMFKHDMQGNILQINKAGAAILGYSAQDILAKNLKDLVEKRDFFEQYMAELQDKKCFNGKGKLVSRDGSPVIFHFNNVLFESHLGDSYILGNGLDMSAYYKVHEDLNEAATAISEERALLRTIIDNIPTNIYVKNTRYEKTLVNRAELEYLGFTEEQQVLGSTDEKWYTHGSAREAQKEDESVVSDGHMIINKEVVQEQKNGRKKYCLISKIPLKDDSGKIIGMVGLTHDISERKKAEIALMEKSRRLDAIIRGTHAGTWEWNINTDEIIINNRYAEMLGYTADELLQFSSQKWNELCHPDDFLHREHLLQKHFDKKSDYYQAEIRLKHKDGHWVWIQDRGKVFTWDSKSGKPTLMYGTHQDISATKEIENQLKEAKESAENANKAKSEFLANMSHEIRTPLNGVIGFTDLLMKTPLSDTQLQYMNTVYQSAHSLLDLINDILDFSKIEAGKMDLSIERADLYELGTQVADITKYQAHSKGLELLVNLSTGLPGFIYADDVRLRQILVNLLTNAIKFTDEGEVELKVEVKNPAENDKSLTLFRFSVRDTGIGIPYEKQRKIFEAFAQEDASTTRKFGGTGLGLSISNKLLELMGSQLQLKSEPGKGSLFFFDIQLRAEKGEEDQWPENHDIERVLVVDDNDTNRNLLQEIMESRNISCLQAANGMAALQLLEKKRDIDLIFMDLRMPFLDGIEVTEKIRRLKHPKLSAVPVVLLSSSNDDALDRDKMQKLSIHHRLIKPIKMQQIGQVLNKVSQSPDGGEMLIEEERQENENILASKKYIVLIAEDNPINMKLSKIILSKVSPTIQIVEADNGLKAYEYVIRQKPDLVLMDVQMPIMNGYETARAIRSVKNGKDLPIIALTAGTVKGEKERCLEAGMDDYMSKPLVQNSLTSMITKWLLPEQQPENPGQQLEKMQDSESKHFDKIHLLSLFDGDKAIGRELLKIARTTLEESQDKLSKALDDKDQKSLLEVGHKLKGSAATAGFFRLLPLTDQLEKVAEAGKYQTLFNIGAQIKTELNYLLANYDTFKL